MRILLFVTMSLGLFGAVAAFAEDAPIPIGLRSALARADLEKRNVVIEVFSQDNVESRIVRDRTFKDAKVKDFIDQHFVEYIVDAGQQPEFEKKYEIKRFPTVILVRPDGSEVDRLTGGFFPRTLMGVLEPVAEGKSELLDLKGAVALPGAGVALHMALGNAFGIRGLRSEALTEYLWCLEQGPRVDPNGYRATLNIILLRIDSLAAYLPEAAAALRDQRAKLAAAVKPDDPASVKAAFAFNDVLQTHENSLQLFDQLPVHSPLRRTNFPSVFGELVKQQRYADAAGLLDLESFVYLAYPPVFSEQAVDDSTAPDSEKRNREAVAARQKQRIDDLTVTAVEALLGVGKLEKAKRLAGRALEEYDSRDLRFNLVHAANRAATPAATEFVAWLETKVTPPAKKPQ